MMAGSDVRLKVDVRVAPAGTVRELARVVREYPGDSAVFIELTTSLGPKMLLLGDEYRVNPCPGLFDAVRSLLGDESVSSPTVARRRLPWQRVAYIDETYNRQSYWICCVVVDLAATAGLQEALSNVAVKAAEAWNLEQVPELHGYELFHGARGFRGVPPRARVGVYREALHAIATQRPDIVLRGVATERIRLQHPHRLAWRWAIESVDELPGDGRILAVADRRIEMEASLRRDIRDYIQYGTGGWKSRRIEKVLADLQFHDSRANALLQAADLVAFLHQRRLNLPVESDPRSQRAREALWSIVAPHVRVQRLWDPPLTHGEPPEGAPGWAA